jgi:hypothetical protein
VSLVLAVYFIGIIGQLKGALAGLIAVSTIGLLAGNLVYALICEDGRKPFSFIKWPLYVLIPCVIIATFLPSKQTAYAMLAAYGVTEVASNERVQTLADNSLQVLEKAMKEFLSEETKNLKDKVEEEIL